MEERLDRVVSLPRESGSAEERMLRGDLVREIVARKERGKGVQADRARTRGRSQDGQALAEARQFAAAASLKPARARAICDPVWTERTSPSPVTLSHESGKTYPRGILPGPPATLWSRLSGSEYCQQGCRSPVRTTSRLSMHPQGAGAAEVLARDGDFT
jgi:hypothetical protein